MVLADIPADRYSCIPEKMGCCSLQTVVINFSSLSKERADYSSLAAFLVTSVNVDSDWQRRSEKHCLNWLWKLIAMSATGKRCLICGGHGAVSVLEEESLCLMELLSGISHIPHDIRKKGYNNRDSGLLFFRLSRNAQLEAKRSRGFHPAAVASPMR